MIRFHENYRPEESGDPDDRFKDSTNPYLKGFERAPALDVEKDFDAKAENDGERIMDVWNIEDEETDREALASLRRSLESLDDQELRRMSGNRHEDSAMPQFSDRIRAEDRRRAFQVPVINMKRGSEKEIKSAGLFGAIFGMFRNAVSWSLSKINSMTGRSAGKR